MFCKKVLFTTKHPHYILSAWGRKKNHIGRLCVRLMKTHLRVLVAFTLSSYGALAERNDLDEPFEKMGDGDEVRF